MPDVCRSDGGGRVGVKSVRVRALSRPEPGLLTGPETEQTGVMLDTGQVTDPVH